MTLEELRVLAEVAMKDARLEVERKGSVTPRFLIAIADDVLMFPLEGHLGELMNSGRADKIFGHFRELIRKQNAAGCVFITEAVTRAQVILCNAQSADDVILLRLEFSRDERLQLVTFAALEEERLKQAQFGGRQKMYGDLRPEDLR